MKKGQKVRVLADNRVGVIADSHFFHWGGKRMVQHQVKFPDTKGDAPWFPAEKLTTKIVEETSAVITGEKGIVYLTFSQDHAKGTSSLCMTGSPENLKEHRGTHVSLAFAMLAGLNSVYDFKPTRETVVKG